MTIDKGIIQELKFQFPDLILEIQDTCDAIPTLWTPEHAINRLLIYLKNSCAQPYKMLFDLTAIDERLKSHSTGPKRDFTIVYTLLSLLRNEFIRIKVGLIGEFPNTHSISNIWPNANWYEREIWDLFGIQFRDHPNLRRILLPPWWTGHPLRKEYPARATEAGPFTFSEEQERLTDQSLLFNPAEWGITPTKNGTEFMFLNMGPQHPGTHGPFRIILELDGEEIVNLIPDIGFHHRGAEKMAERQTWHTYIPYTDRVDYLGGVMNNLPYV